MLLGGLPSGRLALALHQLHPAARSLVTLVRTTRLKAPEFDDLAHVQTTRDLQPLFDQRVRAAAGGFTRGGMQKQTVSPTWSLERGGPKPTREIMN